MVLGSYCNPFTLSVSKSLTSYGQLGRNACSTNGKHVQQYREGGVRGKMSYYCSKRCIAGILYCTTLNNVFLLSLLSHEQWLGTPSINARDCFLLRMRERQSFVNSVNQSIFSLSFIRCDAFLFFSCPPLHNDANKLNFSPHATLPFLISSF